MFCATRIEKQTGEDLLLCRVGEEAYETAIERDDCIPLSTGRDMKGFLFVVEHGFKTDKELDYWLQLCLNYNPLARRSKR